jgi:hypothetical protein
MATPTYSRPIRTNTDVQLDGRAVIRAVREDLESEGRDDLIDWLDANQLRLRPFVVAQIEKAKGGGAKPPAAQYQASQVASLKQKIAALFLELSE